MFKRRLLLLTLFTALGMARMTGQQNVHVHGIVTDLSGNLLPDISIFVSGFYTDSTVIYESLLTQQNGDYAVDIAAPGPNVAGIVQVGMVDCFGTVNYQYFDVSHSGPFDLQADFGYCQNANFDSCAVYIVEESNPGALNSLTAYTYVNGNFNYHWSTGETTQSIYPVSEGVYTVEVDFPWGCIGIDSFYFLFDTFPACYGYISAWPNSNGTYFLESFGQGMAPFTYAWSNGAATSGITVPPGAYCVTITDATGCSHAPCIILDSATCNVSIIPDPLVSSLTAIGFGVEPITFIWNTGEVGATIYPNAPGTYCVTAIDTTGCSAEACFDFGIFDSCYVYIAPVYIDSTTVGLQAFGNLIGWTSSYLWNTGDTTEIIIPQDPSFEYCVTTTNANGCTASACYDISQSCYAWADVVYIDTLSAELTAYSDPVFQWGSGLVSYAWSNGGTTETITVHENGQYCVTVTLDSICTAEACVYVDFDSLGFACATWVTQFQDPATNLWYAQAYSWGFGTFSYLWSNGDTSDIIELDSPNEFVCVTATNTFGCESTACVDTFFNPCQVYIDIAYFSSGAVLTASSWYGGAINQGTFVWSTGQTGNVLTVINNGYYCVTFNSFNGCSSTTCIQVNLGNVDSCGVWVSVVPSPAGIIYTANNWGVAPYTYLWSNGSTEQIQVIDIGDPNVCVTVTDAVGCVAIGCSFDTLSGGVNVINGYVSADSLLLLTAKVLLYSIDSNTGEPFDLVDSTQTGDYGFYQFNNLANGAYLVKAQINPGSVGYEQYLPTYHVSSTTWEEANPSIIPNWLPITTDIWMQHVTGTPGGGIIGGGVLDPHGIVAGGGEPRDLVGLPNVEVILKNESGDPLDFVFSAADGSFRFPDLAFGTYRLSYDIPGLHSPDIWVTISAADPERLQVTLIVNQTSSTDGPVAQELSLYPNPAKNQINIRMPVVHATYDVQIVDMQGRVAYTGSVKSANSILPVEVGQLSPGLFHINMKGENQYYYSRFLKLE